MLARLSGALAIAVAALEAGAGVDGLEDCAGMGGNDGRGGLGDPAAELQGEGTEQARARRQLDLAARRRHRRGGRLRLRGCSDPRSPCPGPETPSRRPASAKDSSGRHRLGWVEAERRSLPGFRSLQLEGWAWLAIPASPVSQRAGFGLRLSISRLSFRLGLCLQPALVLAWTLFQPALFRPGLSLAGLGAGTGMSLPAAGCSSTAIASINVAEAPTERFFIRASCWH